MGHQPRISADALAGPRFEWRPLTYEYFVVFEQRHEELSDAHLRVRVSVRIRVRVRDGVRIRVRVRDGVRVRVRDGVRVRVRVTIHVLRSCFSTVAFSTAYGRSPTFIAARPALSHGNACSCKGLRARCGGGLRLVP